MEDIKRIDRKLIYSGAIVDFYDDTMAFANGNTSHWDIVEHRKGAAAVIPVMEDGRIIMVRQYRSAINKETIEIPAGAKDEKTEPAIECASRELEEETGFRAGKMEKLITVATTVAFCNEVIEVFVATDLTKTQQNLDENEYINLEYYTIDELKDKVLSSEIWDSKTIGAIMALYARREEFGI